MAKTLGLDYKLDIPSDEELSRQLGQKIFLDQEMYEKILFNLCKRLQVQPIRVLRYFPTNLSFAFF